MRDWLKNSNWQAIAAIAALLAVAFGPYALLRGDLNRIDDRIWAMGQDMNAQFDKVNEKFDKVNEKFDQVNEKFDQVNEKFDKVNERLTDIEKRLGIVEDRIGIQGRRSGASAESLAPNLPDSERKPRAITQSPVQR